MKRAILLIVILASVASRLSAARLCPSTGRVVDEQGNAVEYATVVLLKGAEQVAGRTTDARGRFELKAAPGDYTLQIQFLGFDPVTKAVRVEADNDLGVFVMRASATGIESVVVKAQLVRREADRFVVDVANAPAAIGKDGIELLERAPGVWIDGEKISINGKSGSKIYVNDRELRMEPEQLLTYLRSLRAEEIRKIEVVPVTGADYDADSAGGVIRITLKKRRENGIDGSVAYNTTQSGITDRHNPSANINVHSGRADLYASVWGSFGSDRTITDEQTLYNAADKSLSAHSEMKGRTRSFGASAGTVVEIAPRHSIGTEFEYWRNRDGEPNDTYTDFRTADETVRTESRFDNRNHRDNYSATFNYIWKIDTLGSTLKLLADYTRRETDTRNDNESRITAPGSVLDSVYRDNATSLYDIAAATLALEKHFSPRWSLKAGAKYTRNDMRNDALYEYRRGDAWLRNERQSFTINYTENIAAAYGIASANLGRWSLVAGVRGEYTRTEGKGHGIAQNYFSLFPNANVSYALTKDGAYSLIAQYARTIERPRFWTLNPQRFQISDYTYQTGNPELDPAYKHDASLTLVLKHKYTLTGGTVVQTGEIQQTMRPDADDPKRLCMAWVNYDTTKSYYVSANAPCQFAKWWTMNLNATYIRQGQRIDQHTPEKHYNLYFANASTTFTLPAKFYIDLSYRFQSRMDFGNCWVEPMHFLNAGIKKRFGDKFTAACSVRNLIDRPQHVGARGEGFVRRVDVSQQWNCREFRISLSYNFKSGKAFKRRAVEAGSADEKSRL
mgnify:FL=1